MSDSLNDLELGEFLDWPLVPQVVVIVMLCTVISVGGYYKFIKPEIAQLEEMKAEEFALLDELQEKMNQEKAIELLADQVDMLEARYERVTMQLPEEEELAALLSDINERGVDAGLAFNRIDWAARVKNQGFEEIPLSMSITGDYNQVGDFSSAIADMPRLVMLHDFNITRDGSEELGMQVAAKTFRFVEEVENAAPAQ
uniref:type 4a pilus biogenesis protein PilO n=1 Tax=Thaumasiovibrio occultus TaxID=1891184 RepID=UPI000B35E490|nr:type 4a pilus biogenesis protein PilO [Thaumasiovibrio occultus]